MSGIGIVCSAQLITCHKFKRNWEELQNPSINHLSSLFVSSQTPMAEF